MINVSYPIPVKQAVEVIEKLKFSEIIKLTSWKSATFVVNLSKFNILTSL